MKFYDALMFLGRACGLEPYQAADPDSIRKTLDRYGISRAVVSSFAPRRPGVDYLNDQTFDAALGDARIIPAPVVIPNTGLEVGDEEAYIDGLIRDGARCVFFYPDTCGAGLDRRVVGGLFAAIEKRRLPVALFETGWPDAATFANRYPGSGGSDWSTCSGSKCSPAYKYATDEAAAAAAAGITIHTIGLGTSADAGLLEEIASIGRGAFFDTPDPADLQATFAEVAGYIGVALIE